MQSSRWPPIRCGTIAADAADPYHAETEACEPDAGIAFGAGVIDPDLRGGSHRLARRRREYNHRLAERDQIPRHRTGRIR